MEENSQGSSAAEIAETLHAVQALARRVPDTIQQTLQQLPSNTSSESDHKPVPDTEPYSQADALLITVFNTLTKRQQARLIREALKPKDKLKAITVREAKTEHERKKNLHTLKKYALIAVFVSAFAFALTVGGVFLWKIFNTGALTAEGSVFTGLFKTLAMVLKIIWSAPSGGS